MVHMRIFPLKGFMLVMIIERQRKNLFLAKLGNFLKNILKKRFIPIIKCDLNPAL